EALGLTPDALRALTGQRQLAAAPELRSAEAEDLYARLASPDALTAQRSTFGRREVLQAVAETLPAGADIEAITQLSDSFLSSRHVVRLAQARGLRRSDVIRRRDGGVVSTRADEARWTTPELLAVEARVVEHAVQRQRDHVAVAPHEHVQAVLKTSPSLSGE